MRWVDLCACVKGQPRRGDLRFLKLPLRGFLTSFTATEHPWAFPQQSLLCPCQQIAAVVSRHSSGTELQFTYRAEKLWANSGNAFYTTKSRLLKSPGDLFLLTSGFLCSLSILPFTDFVIPCFHLWPFNMSSIVRLRISLDTLKDYYLYLNEQVFNTVKIGVMNGIENT